MRIKLFLFTALVGIGAIACSKNGDINTENDGGIAKGGSIELTLGGIGGGDGNRAVGLPATTKTTVSSLSIIFTNVGGEVLFVEELSPQENLDKWNSLMGIGDVAQPAPVTFHDLPEGIEQIHIYGNIKDRVGTPSYSVGSNVSIFATTMYDLADMGDISSAILVGKDLELTPVIEPDSGHTLWQAELTIAPTVSRIEIGNIQCANLNNTIKSFNIKAIGVDNIFESISFDGTSTTAIETVKQLEIVGNNNEAIGNPLPEWAYDNIDPIIISTTGTYNPQTTDNALVLNGNGKYVYHIVPQRQHVRTSIDAIPDANSVGADIANAIGVSPKIRFELSDVVASSGTVRPNERWVTAVFNGEANPRIFEAGKIYQVNLRFNENNITVPDPSQIVCVEVNVSVADWVIEPAFTPDYE